MASSYPLAVSSWDEEELEIFRGLTAQSRMTMGEAVTAFEEKFAATMGASYCVMVNSGSSANLLAIASLFYRSEAPLCRGDQVIVPAVSWGTSYFPLQQYGLKLRFVDIDKDTLNLDVKALEAAISDNTRLVLAVNLLGNPCQFDSIRSLCARYGSLLVEDNCESMGARFGNRYSGTFGVLGTFSTYFSHHISTIEGGLVLTDDEELYHILLSLRSHGWTRSLPENNQLTKKSGRKFEESFRFILPGYNLRPAEINGLLGQVQLGKLGTFLKNRQANARYFKSLFSSIPCLRLQTETGESSWFGFSLVLEREASGLRDALADFLDENGIESRPIVAGNFTSNEVLRYIDHDIHGELDAAREIDACGLYLGNHHFPLNNEIDYAFDKINGFLKSRLV